MKIFQVTADFPPKTGGVASHVYELSHALQELGHECTVLTTVHQSSQFDKLNAVLIKRLRVPRFQPFYDMYLRHVLAKYNSSNQPDIFHVHGMRPLVASKCLNIPVIFTNHTSGFLKRITKGSFEVKKIEKRINHISHVIAPSIELIEATRKAGYKKKATYIPNGVDIERFTYQGANIRSKLNIGKNEFVILVARRLVPKNGVLDFARSTMFIKNRKFKIIIAGDGPDRDAIKSELEVNGMIDRTIFLGNVSNAKMPEVYRSANLSILPSHMEATSITGLESIASGLPLVGTRVGGIPELIKDGENGYLVDKSSPEQLGKAIENCLSSRVDLKAFSLKSLELSKGFSWPVIASRTAEIYQNLL